MEKWGKLCDFAISSVSRRNEFIALANELQNVFSKLLNFI